MRAPHPHQHRWLLRRVCVSISQGFHWHLFSFALKVLTMTTFSQASFHQVHLLCKCPYKPFVHLLCHLSFSSSFLPTTLQKTFLNLRVRPSCGPADRIHDLTGLSPHILRVTLVRPRSSQLLSISEPLDILFLLSGCPALLPYPSSRSLPGSLLEEACPPHTSTQTASPPPLCAPFTT